MIGQIGKNMDGDKLMRLRGARCILVYDEGIIYWDWFDKCQPNVDVVRSLLDSLGGTWI